MRLTLDSNILVYAFDTLDRTKQDIAIDLILRATACDLVVTMQSLGEFIAVIRRKHPASLSDAVIQARRIAALFPPVATQFDHLVAAATLADRYHLQFWDSLILSVARSAGVAVMLTEDMQDGAAIDGVTLLNPFKPGNSDRLAALLVG